MRRRGAFYDALIPGFACAPKVSSSCARVKRFRRGERGVCRAREGHYRPGMRMGSAIAAAALWMWAGCGEPPSSTAAQQIVAPDDTEGDPNAPESAEPAGASLDETLTLKAKKHAKDWSTAAPTIRGELHEGGRSDHLLVMRAGFCY